MQTLEIKTSHPVIRDFYKETKELLASGDTKEGAVAPFFGNILLQCSKSLGFKFVQQHTIRPKGNKRLQTDGTVTPCATIYNLLIFMIRKF